MHLKTFYCDLVARACLGFVLSEQLFSSRNITE